MAWSGVKPILAVISLLLTTSLLVTTLKLAALSKHYIEALIIHQDNKRLNDTTRGTSSAVKMDLNRSISIYAGGRNANVSRILWQIWKTPQLPAVIERYWNKSMKENPTYYEHRVVGDVEATEFMKQHFSGPTYDAYKSINPAIGAMRADMWRYCALYKYGGVYLDVDSYLAEGWNPDEWINQRSIVSCLPYRFEQKCIKELRCPKIWASVNMTFPKSVVGDCPMAQGLLVFPKPGNPILWETIQMYTSLISAWNDTQQQSQRWSMFHKVICLTGPCMFSVAIQNAYVAANGDWDKLEADLMGGKYEGRVKDHPKFRKAMYYKASEDSNYRKFSSTAPLKQEISN